MKNGNEGRDILGNHESVTVLVTVKVKSLILPMHWPTCQLTINRLSVNCQPTCWPLVIFLTHKMHQWCVSRHIGQRVSRIGFFTFVTNGMCITSMSHHSLMDFFMMLMISITIIFIAATRKKVHQSQKKKINRNKSTYY